MDRTQLRAEASSFKPSAYAKPYVPSAGPSKAELKLNSNAKPFTPKSLSPTARPFSPSATVASFTPRPTTTPNRTSFASNTYPQQQNVYTQASPTNFSYGSTQSPMANGVRTTTPRPAMQQFFTSSPTNSIYSAPSLNQSSQTQLPSPATTTTPRPSFPVFSPSSRSSTSLNQIVAKKGIPEFVPGASPVAHTSDPHGSMGPPPPRLPIANHQPATSPDEQNNVKIPEEISPLPQIRRNRSVPLEFDEKTKQRAEKLERLPMNSYATFEVNTNQDSKVVTSDIGESKEIEKKNEEVIKDESKEKEMNASQSGDVMENENIEIEEKIPTRRLFRPRVNKGFSSKFSFSARPKAKPVLSTLSSPSLITPTPTPIIATPAKEETDTIMEDAEVIDSPKSSVHADKKVRVDKENSKVIEKPDVVMKDSNPNKKKFYALDWMMHQKELPANKVAPQGLPSTEDLVGSGRSAFGGGRSSNMYGNRVGAGGRNSRYGGGRVGIRRDNRKSRDEDMTPVEPLKKSENRYVATRKDNLDAHAKSLREIKSILNKLTPEKFDTLVKRFEQDCPINDLQTLKDVVNCVFEKALQEAPFCPTYAKFCLTVCNKMKIKSDDQSFFEDGKVQTFRRVLLNGCQREFMSHSNNTGTEEEKKQKKKRLIGTIKFIGELYLVKMVKVNIIKECINTLLVVDEENLEALCQLLETCGKVVDSSQPQMLNVPFAKLKLWAKDADISMRIRFKLKDTIELRQKNWKARIEKVSAKKISEIHKEDRKEKEKKKAQANKNRRTPRGLPPQMVDRYSSRSNKKSRGGRDDWSQPISGRKKRSDDSRRRFDDGRRSMNYKKKDAPQKRQKNADSQVNRNTFDMLDIDEDEDNYGKRSNRSERLNSSRSRMDPGSTRSRTSERQQDRKPEIDRRNSRESAPPQNRTPQNRTPQKRDQDPIIRPIQLGNENPADKEETKKKVGSLFKELFMSHDLDEAMMCVDDLDKQYHYLVFSSGIKTAADDMKTKSLQLTIEIFNKLSKPKGAFSPAIVTRGLVTLLEGIQDASYDMPKIWEIAAEVLARMIHIKMTSLTHFTSINTSDLHQYNKLVCYTLSFIKKFYGASEMVSSFARSGIQLKDLVKPNGRSKPEDLLDRYQLKELMKC